MSRHVKVSIVLEFELETDVDEDDDLVTSLQEKFDGAIRPDWKGMHFPGNFPGTFVGKANRVGIAIGHGRFVWDEPAPAAGSTPEPMKAGRRRKRR